MSGMPVFADPSTAVVYHTVPPASGRSSRQGYVAGGHPPQPPTVAMMVVQNNPPQQQQQPASSNLPLPPGMEIVLGDKKYKIQYQSYEMTREKATEYIAKCTGTPYSRMSSPPDPEAIPQHPSVVGGIRAEARVGLGGTTAIPTAADRYQRPRSPRVPAAAAAPTGVTSVAMAATAGDRGTVLTSSPPTAVLEEKEPRRKFPDEVLTGMTPAASGTAPPIAWGAVPPQQQQQVSKAPEPPAVPTETSVYATSAYAPPPPPQPSGADQQDSQNLGYYWEDGVWKVWQANSSESTTAASDAAAATTATATAKMPPPLPVPVQQKPYAQAPQPPYPPPAQAADRAQYQYQYQFHYPPQQPQQPSVVATSTAHEPSSYVLPHVPQPQHLSQQPPQIRAPPPGLLPAQGNPGSSTPAAPGTDPMVPRYMI